jgi:apolipoprotein N-acyltransferase
MNPASATSQTAPVRRTGILVWVLVAFAAFHAAYATVATIWLIVIYLFALLQLAQADKWRKAFYPGLAVGLLIAVGRLEFFWNIFSGGAFALWLVYAFWIGLFVVLARLCVRRIGPKWGWLLIPFVWVGLEYFRSELYYLRFSWLNPGYTFAGAPWIVPLKHMGMYGLGFLLMSIACAAAFLWQKSWLRSAAALIIGVGGIGLWSLAVGREQSPPSLAAVRIAGVQMEFPKEPEVLLQLNELLGKRPDTDLIVLSEYTFDGPEPEKVRDWSRTNPRYLIVGGKDSAPNANFYDTAFVIGPAGEIVFRQVKSVPIQFFKDGLPAPDQKLWDSPWGRIGICVCYDLSYARVTDRLVKLGAQALIVPTMDVMDWGRRQHELHARVAPVRAAEYGIPIFRLASSGISQWVDRTGRVAAVSPCPGDGAILSATLEMRGAGALPCDRWLAPFSTGLTALISVFFLIRTRFGLRTSDFGPQPSPTEQIHT